MMAGIKFGAEAAGGGSTVHQHSGPTSPMLSVMKKELDDLKSVGTDIPSLRSLMPVLMSHGHLPCGP